MDGINWGLPPLSFTKYENKFIKNMATDRNLIQTFQGLIGKWCGSYNMEGNFYQ